jgi:hypothetical protein
LSDELKEVRVPIGGWLILVAIILWATAIFSPLSLGLELLLQPVSTSTWLEVMYSAGTAVISITTLVVFMKRRRTLVYWFIGLQVWAILYYIVFLIIGVNLYTDLFGIIENVVLLLYIVRSKRVKNTFVR